MKDPIFDKLYRAAMTTGAVLIIGLNSASGSWIGVSLGVALLFINLMAMQIELTKKD